VAISVKTPTTSAVEAGVTRPRRLHHAAWVTRDSAATRHFYEDILGLPLVATWAERAPMPGGGTRDYVHTFFALADGGALAFFQHADQDERPIDLSSPGHWRSNATPRRSGASSNGWKPAAMRSG
jgi:catechol 2,3-dioxygenase-like lactoylglutathione lyase family enzyme